MSHLVTVKTQIRDKTAIDRCHLPPSRLARPIVGQIKLYSAEAEGLIVQLPDWLYPVVIDTASGSVKFDDFEGNWGEQVQLDKFLQIYAVEKADLEARKHGHTFTETTLSDGSIQLRIQETHA